MWYDQVQSEHRRVYIYILLWRGEGVLCVHKCSVSTMCKSVQEGCGSERAVHLGHSQMAKDFF